MSETLTAARVHLRPLEAADSARLFDWRNRPEVAQHMYTDHIIAPDEHDRWFAGALIDAARQYWIIECDGVPVGIANLYDIAPAHRRCAWAFYLADPSTRGRGVGAYVEYFVLSHVFETMGFAKLCCEVLAANEAVWRMHESFGFQREAHYRDHIVKAGKSEDVFGLAMLASEWRAAKPALRERLSHKGFTLP